MAHRRPHHSARDFMPIVQASGQHGGDHPAVAYRATAHQRPVGRQDDFIGVRTSDRPADEVLRRRQRPSRKPSRWRWIHNTAAPSAPGVCPRASRNASSAVRESVDWTGTSNIGIVSGVATDLRPAGRRPGRNASQRPSHDHAVATGSDDERAIDLAGARESAPRSPSAHTCVAALRHRARTPTDRPRRGAALRARVVRVVALHPGRSQRGRSRILRVAAGFQHRGPCSARLAATDMACSSI